MFVDTVVAPCMAYKSDMVLYQQFGTGKGSGAAFLLAAIGIMGILIYVIIFSKHKAVKNWKDRIYNFAIQ